MHAFQDMMLEEETHVKMLKDEYKRLGGNVEFNYDPHKYGQRFQGAEEPTQQKPILRSPYPVIVVPHFLIQL